MHKRKENKSLSSEQPVCMEYFTTTSFVPFLSQPERLLPLEIKWFICKQKMNSFITEPEREKHKNRWWETYCSQKHNEPILLRRWANSLEVTTKAADKVKRHKHFSYDHQIKEAVCSWRTDAHTFIKKKAQNVQPAGRVVSGKRNNVLKHDRMRWWPLQGWAGSPPAAPGSIGYKGGGRAGVTAGRHSFLLHIDLSVKKLRDGRGRGVSNDQSQRATFSHGGRFSCSDFPNGNADEASGTSARFNGHCGMCSVLRVWTDYQMTRHLFESVWNSQVGRVQRSSIQWRPEWPLTFYKSYKKIESFVKALIVPRLWICLTVKNRHWLESTE